MHLRLSVFSHIMITGEFIYVWNLALPKCYSQLIYSTFGKFYNTLSHRKIQNIGTQEDCRTLCEMYGVYRVQQSESDIFPVHCISTGLPNVELHIIIRYYTDIPL